MADKPYLPWDKIVDFVRALVKDNFSELDTTIGILWYSHFTKDMKPSMPTSFSSDDIKRIVKGAGYMNEHEFDESHISFYLGRKENKYIYYGKDYRYYLQTKFIAELNEIYQKYTNLPPEIPITSPLITPLKIQNGNSLNTLLPILIEEANKTYECRLFNSCALLCRRILEILLIKTFKKKGLESDILSNGYYLTLGELIGKANSGKYFQLTKATKKCLENAKKTGDIAAHSEFVTVKNKSIDKFKSDIDIAIKELLEKAEIQIVSED